jgi:Zn-dependent peptidase ImmA (M78 family)
VTILSRAERVLQELGITDPGEIDLEAIAWHLGVRIRIAELDGCEARSIGYRDRAIVRVERRTHPRRRRFSIAHELGHWCHHRGRMLICRAEDIGSHNPATPEIERVADGYAADLLLPRYLFLPLSRQYAKLNFGVVRELADLFDTSLTATAIRLAKSRHSPAMLICHGPQGRKWFTRSPDVPARWFPRDELDPESFAFELLFGLGEEQAHPRLIGADAWFDRQEAQRYELWEQSTRIANDEVLVLLILRDDGMLED